ncbi:hypothetical protein IV203_003589 [Nitzschia inconspicua]|uniref:Methyltransferase domain-containing protein n=1 Tax=Nitzschia inconspicua TaxID=303405 RepID=A0A9K3L236_9STRA|nr:hypothetical protein IV203_003589 [Nitzschia inconspicua]
MSKTTVVSGILFSRSVRSSFASLTLAPLASAAASTTAVASEPPKHNTNPFLVRIQFPAPNSNSNSNNNHDDNDTNNLITELRSYCRRHYKLGDRIDISHGQLEDCHNCTNGNNSIQQNTTSSSSQLSKSLSSCSWSQQPRYVVAVNSPQHAMEAIQVSASQVWTMKQCQEFQNRYLPTKTKKKDTATAAAAAATRTVVTGVRILDAHKNHCSDVAATTNSQQQQQQEEEEQREQSNHHHHGGNNHDKRLQAERMVQVFLQTLGEALFSSSLQPHTETNKNDIIIDITKPQMQQQRQQLLQTYLNQGSGVLDIAGGSGYVSMALALQGIQSTVIDARSSVGKLPGKDRKLYRRKLQEQARQKRETIPQRTNNESRMMTMNEWEYCQPTIVPFNAHRAWFGTKPSGVDQSFRHPDEEEIPTLSLLDCIGNSSSSNGRHLLHASALVGLHPDEATADIVKEAVQLRIPFMVVPCCVFARLFPHRRKRDGNPVNTYEDLLQYLQEMDPSIQRMTLPLEGRNIALWSTFDR